MKQPIYWKQLELGPMQNYVYLFGDPETTTQSITDIVTLDAGGPEVVEPLPRLGAEVRLAGPAEMMPDGIPQLSIDEAIAGVSGIVEKSAPVNEIVTAILNCSPTARTTP